MRSIQRRDDLVDLPGWTRGSPPATELIRGPAFLDGSKALLDGEPPGEDVVGRWILPQPAHAQVALVQRLELEHQRELLAAVEPLVHHVSADCGRSVAEAFPWLRSYTSVLA